MVSGRLLFSFLFFAHWMIINPSIKNGQQRKLCWNKTNIKLNSMTTCYYIYCFWKFHGTAANKIHPQILELRAYPMGLSNNPSPLLLGRGIIWSQDRSCVSGQRKPSRKGRDRAGIPVHRAKTANFNVVLHNMTAILCERTTSIAIHNHKYSKEYNIFVLKTNTWSVLRPAMNKFVTFTRART